MVLKAVPLILSAWAECSLGEAAALRGRRDIVVIGAASGGLTAICKLLGSLPSAFDAAILIALDFGAQPAPVVLQILRSCSRLPVDYAADGAAVYRGRVFVAPALHDLRAVWPGILAVDDINTFDMCRPSTDQLFRSVASAYGPRVIGIVLNGATHDGTAGLTAIEAKGGVGIVQDRDEAVDSTMPSSALRREHPDCCSPIARMASLIVNLAAGQKPSVRAI